MEEDLEASEGSGLAVVIVNYNGWRDTIVCLESVFNGRLVPDVVVVCDNASSDGSLEHIRRWAEGEVTPESPGDPRIRACLEPGRHKPLSHFVHNRKACERGGDRQMPSGSLVLIDTGANLGFAGGNNVGLRYLLASGKHSEIWLLNPDTVVDPSAAEELVSRMRADRSIGMCGSTVCEYDRPESVQALGGANHNWWLALPRHIGSGTSAAEPISESSVAARMTYVYGASMMLSRRFLEEVGLLDESYFLYFEELDLAMRGSRRGFRLAYSPESIVFHKGSTATSVEGSRTALADYHFLRNRLRVTRKYRPVAFPTAYLAVAYAAIRRALRGEWRLMRNAAALLIGMKGGIS
jgi:GT2 family glycosyltransferase